MLNSYLYYILMFAVVGVPFYFQHRMQNIAKDIEAIPVMNALSAKLVAFIVVAIYLMSFLSFKTKSHAFFNVGYGACVLSIFLLFSFRGKLIHQIREIPANPKERFEKSFRTLLSMSLLYGIYFSTIHFLIPHIGAFPSAAVAMIFITYSSPLFIRVWMPSQKMHPSSIKEEILQVFASANNPVSEVYLIDTDRFKSYNALVCGPKFGFGPFRRSVFVTKNLFEVLEPEEIRAVICHEAAHFKLHHVLKRGCMSILAVLVSLFCVFLPISFLGIIFHLKNDDQFGLLMLSTIATIVIQFAFIFRVIRKQEFEADLEAINIGTTSAALSSALEKITIKNGGSTKKESGFTRFVFGSAHPQLEERIQAIRSGVMPFDSKIIPAWKFTASYASFVIVLGAIAALQFEPKRNLTGNREVASVISESSGQILPTADNKIEENTKDSDE